MSQLLSSLERDCCKGYVDIKSNGNVEIWVQSYPLSPRNVNSVSWNLPKKQFIVLCCILLSRIETVSLDCSLLTTAKKLPVNGCFWVNFPDFGKSSCSLAFPARADSPPNLFFFLWIQMWTSSWYTLWNCFFLCVCEELFNSQAMISGNQLVQLKENEMPPCFNNTVIMKIVFPQLK